MGFKNFGAFWLLFVNTNIVKISFLRSDAQHDMASSF